MMPQVICWSVSSHGALIVGRCPACTPAYHPSENGSSRLCETMRVSCVVKLPPLLLIILRLILLKLMIMLLMGMLLIMLLLIRMTETKNHYLVTTTRPISLTGTTAIRHARKLC